MGYNKKKGLSQKVSLSFFNFPLRRKPLLPIQWENAPGLSLFSSDSERLVAKTLKPFLDLSAVRAHFVAVDAKAFLHVSIGVRTAYIGHGIR